MNPIAITGLGVTSSLGTGASSTLDRLRDPELLAGMTEPRPITSFDASHLANPPILEVQDFEPAKHLGDKGLRTLDRLTKLLLVAGRLACHHAGLKKDGAWVALSGDRVGVCCSNAYGSLEAITELDRVAVLEDARYINPSKFPNTVSNSASGYVSIWEDLRALNVSVSDGNCGALDAVSCASLLLDTGRAEAILTGGGESMSEALYLAFDKVGALTGLSPLARLGEGAAFVVLEPPSRADARGASTLGLVLGYGTAFLAPESDVTLLSASRVALERAMAQALADAGISARDVDLVITGTSGIAQFDDEERAAIRSLFGAEVATAAPKRAFGETLGAGGALAIVAALAWFGEHTIPLLETGPNPAKVETVLITSLGYYGNASALVLRAPRA